MQHHNLLNEPQEVYNLRGDAARITFVKNFKEVQRYKTQLDQYTDITEEQQAEINAILPETTLQEFRSSYIETAKMLREIQQKEGDKAPENVQQLDFEFVLFASAIIDYDYIMSLIADSTQRKPAKQSMTKSQVIALLRSNSNFIDQEEDLVEYINGLDWEKGQQAEALHDGFLQFKTEKYHQQIAVIARRNGLPTEDLQAFIHQIMTRMIFDGEALTDLLAPLDLGWKERKTKELQLMADLLPQLKKLAEGREISGLAAYE